MVDNYFEWLRAQIDPDGVCHEHDELLKTLYFREFEWSTKGNLARDENRAIDGKELRRRYEDISGEHMDLTKPASILEVLIALAINIDGGLAAGEGEHPRWFWLMLANLGVLEKGVEVNYILSRWIYRQFKFDGEGSPFPLRICKYDQRKVELWLQACGYFSEEIEINW